MTKKRIARFIFSCSVFWRISSLAFITSSCRFLPSHEGPNKISHINIIDRNGLSETISSTPRLKAFETIDFLSPQPYQKVMRVCGRDKSGDIHAFITSYHSNGQIKQYLEACNNRAKGVYREWYANGQLKIDAFVIGGAADINTQAEQSFIFEGVTKAWDEEGFLVAEIPYQKGILSNISRHFHKNGKLWKSISYVNGLVEGAVEIYLEDGSLFQKTHYKKGKKEGFSTRYWDKDRIAFQEQYREDKLIMGHYYNKENLLVASIENGIGQRAIFGQNVLKQLQEYHNGFPQGRIEIYDEQGALSRTYYLKNGEKEGEENTYFSGKTPSTPHILLTWKEGILQGPMKTWYENGTLESLKEMSQNKKHGISTAWYPDGHLMLVEEYEDDKLIKGQYYQKGDNTPVSIIHKGEGIATLFDTEGHLLRKISYRDGKPI